MAREGSSAHEVSLDEVVATLIEER